MSLRGTRTKAQYAQMATRPTLQNQITALKRKVAQQKPETQYFRVSGTHDSSTTPGVAQVSYLPTSSLISSLLFRDNVTGDHWANSYLKFKMFMEPDCKLCRIICYVPRKSGSRFTPGSNQLTSIVDPSSFWVVGDHYLTHDAAGVHTARTFNWNLRKLRTIYDSNSAAIEKGEIVITVLTESSTASLRQWSYGYELMYNNV